jgi:predicted metal-binding membrane protein
LRNFVLPKERIVLLSTLGVVVLLSWVYLFDMAGAMDAGHCASMAGVPWSRGYFTAMLVMWIIMMVGMMVPSAIPTILIYASVVRKAAREGSSLAATEVFVAGYVVIWTLFSLVATIAQWTLDCMALLSPMMMSNNNILGGVLLLAAGGYQLTPFKGACLRHCRSPVQFLASRWKSSRIGAFQMGLEHGAFCLGCCWMLMGLLFFGGVMNLWWIGGLTLFVLLEKILPFGARAGQLMGVILAGCGLLLLVREFS